MQTLRRPQIGMSVEELETPCLVLDMDALDNNMGTMADFYEGKEAKLRGHAKNHKSLGLAHRQIRRGGTVGGVCAAKVAEAEVMIHGGIPHVLLTSEIADLPKLNRLCALARHGQILLACESLQNARDVSTVATELGVEIGLVIEVETSLLRCGVQDLEQGVILAKEISALPGVRLQGVMSHQMMEQPSSEKEDRITEGHRLIQKILDVKSAIEAAGMEVPIVSTGETWSYDVAGEIPGVTEIQGGTYLVMETSYEYMTDFQFAGKVLTTIISTPRPGVAVGDAGIKAVGSLKGMPRVENYPGVEVEAMDADRAIFRIEEDAQLQIGQQLYLIPAQQDAMVSRWDRFVGVRKGKVEAVWDIDARGCHN